MKRPKSDYAIQTVTNALRLLEAFGDHEQLGVTELGRKLGLHKNNVFRLLATLEQRGYVEQAESERYQLGVACLEAGQAFSRSRSILRLARPLLEQLSQTLGETAHLATLRDFEVVHLAGEQSPQMVNTALRVGDRLPVHCTALGKILLGCAEPALQQDFDRDVIGDRPLAARTPASITDRDKFLEHLRTVAGQGYATDLEECEPGMCCAAAGVHDAEGRTVAALSISAPIFRLGPEALLRVAVPAVRAAADSLSRQLGYSG